MYDLTQPGDPSLALCQICANRTDLDLLCMSVDGKLRRFRTCMRYVTGDCNDFVPGNIKGLTLQDRAKMMMEMAQYGRFKA